MTPPPPAETPPEDNPLKQALAAHPRKGGAIMATVGVGFFELFTGSEIRAAEAHAPSVSLSLQATALSVMLFLLGAILMFGGSPAREVLSPAPGRSKVPAVLLGLACGAVGLAAHLWIESYLRGLGYAF